MKIALNMIVKADDGEAEQLSRCLASFTPAFDGIFVTITGDNARCEEVCAAFGAKVSKFKWCGDFSKARNFALSQVPKEYDYWGWADADDTVSDAAGLRRAVEENPDVDAFVFNYQYGFDEFGNPTVVHMKTRVVRNDGSVRWAGRLHEDFSSSRELNAKFVKGIEWVHHPDGERSNVSVLRNLGIAETQAEEEPEDPRTWWNLGNARKAAGMDEKAMEAFTKFVSLSKSEEEKYVAACRMSEIWASQGDDVSALEAARTAVGLRPLYPDAYVTCARILCRMGRFEEAKDLVMASMRMEPAYNKIIVFNPRDYDLEPLKLLAHIYMSMSLPQLALEALVQCQRIVPLDMRVADMIEAISEEAERSRKVVELVDRLRNEDDETLVRELDALDPDYRSHPAVCHLRNTRIIKEKSSGKDLVFFCGFTKDVWTPETARTKGIGGSEEAVIHLSKRLAAAGWNVTVYNNCGHRALEFDGVTYRPFWEWNPRDRQDVTVVWRAPRTLEYDINSAKVYLDVHDALDPGEFTEKRIARCDGFFFKSRCHRELYPRIPEEKCRVIQNGIVWEQVSAPRERDPMLIVNTSSPDRSLSTLLRAFKAVRERVPGAKLKWAYGWNVWDSVHSGDAERERWKAERLAEMEGLDGFEALGRIGHDDVARLYGEASVFGYPTAFYEIDCISARKAQAAGAYPVVTDFAALDETVAHGTKVHADPAKENWGKPRQFDFALMEERAVDEWVEAVVRALENPPTEDERKEMSEWTRQFDWDRIAERWIASL